MTDDQWGLLFCTWLAADIAVRLGMNKSADKIVSLHHYTVHYQAIPR